MGYDMFFCGVCFKDTLHVEGKCIDCTIRENKELNEKLEEDAVALERARQRSKRRPK